MYCCCGCCCYTSGFVGKQNRREKKEGRQEQLRQLRKGQKWRPLPPLLLPPQHENKTVGVPPPPHIMPSLSFKQLCTYIQYGVGIEGRVAGVSPALHHHQPSPAFFHIGSSKPEAGNLPLLPLKDFFLFLRYTKDVWQIVAKVSSFRIKYRIFYNIINF